MRSSPALALILLFGHVFSTGLRSQTWRVDSESLRWGTVSLEKADFTMERLEALSRTLLAANAEREFLRVDFAQDGKNESYLVSLAHETFVSWRARYLVAQSLKEGRAFARLTKIGRDAVLELRTTQGDGLRHSFDTPDPLVLENGCRIIGSLISQVVPRVSIFVRCPELDFKVAETIAARLRVRLSTSLLKVDFREGGQWFPSTLVSDPFAKVEPPPSEQEWRTLRTITCLRSGCPAPVPPAPTPK